ncbi:MAG: pantoate kinase [Halobacteriaceae archaeon]
MSDEARAFVPGHVTAFFSTHRTDDPATTGSRGAGLTLADGVEATVRPADETRVTLNGEAVDLTPVGAVLAAMGVTARVDCETSLPPGAGFGVSGAAALGTALAANAAVDAGRSENELVRVAHVAEVQAGTGLGDVVAQARGGVPVRLEPGAPPHGRLDGVPVPAGTRVEYVTFGELSTAEVIGGDTERLTRAGEAALERLLDRPTLPRLLAAARTFAADAGLVTDDVAAAVEAVREAGGDGSMVMLGRTVFAVGTGLSDAGYDPTVTRTHPSGATVE